MGRQHHGFCGQQRVKGSASAQYSKPAGCAHPNPIFAVRHGQLDPKPENLKSELSDRTLEVEPRAFVLHCGQDTNIVTNRTLVQCRSTLAAARYDSWVAAWLRLTGTIQT